MNERRTQFLFLSWRGGRGSCAISSHAKPQAAYRKGRDGFTLIELLVVIIIIAAGVAVAIPALRVMSDQVGAAVGANSISIASTSARAYATNPNNQFVPRDLLTDTGTPPNPTIGSNEGAYSGAAAIVTPSGEIRLTRNIQNAYDVTGFPLERRGPGVSDEQPGASKTPSRELNGFADIQIDYLTLGADTGLAGIFKPPSSSGAVPTLIAPPFALWYDQNGDLVTPSDGNGDNKIDDYKFVYYDGNYDGRYDVNSNRQNITGGGTYNPGEWDPTSGDFDSDHWNENVKKYELPFEKIETVVGVFSYSKRDLREAVEAGRISGFNGWANTSPGGEIASTSLWEWMKKNGQLQLFSPQSGLLVHGAKR